MSATATLVAATTILALLVITPLWLQHRVRQRIAEQVAATPAPPGPVPGPWPPPPVVATPLLAPLARPDVPLAQLLEGMTLPCDLAPLTFVEPARDVADRLVFVTDWPAERVRADLKGALASVEFDLTWAEGDEGVATREGVAVRVRLHRAPERVTVGSRPAFPTAASGSTVVELAVPS